MPYPYDDNPIEDPNNDNSRFNPETFKNACGWYTYGT